MTSEVQLRDSSGNLISSTNPIPTSATQAPGTSFVVSGAVAVGSAPTVPPVGVSGVDGGGLKRSFLTDTSGKMIVTNAADSASAPTTLNLNESVTVAVGADIKSWGVLINGTFTGTVGFQVSTDGGATYGSAVVQLCGSSSASGYVTAVTTPSSGPYAAPVQPGVTHVRAICTALSSGNPVVTVFTSAKPVTAFGPGVMALAGGNNRVGYVASAAIWTRESATPVNATQTITGAAKGTFNSASGSALSGASSYGRLFAASAGADVSGTLVIDASPDSGTTWYPVASIALAQVGGSGNFGAYLETAICEATMRARLVNGGTNQTRAYLTTRMLG